MMRVNCRKWMRGICRFGSLLAISSALILNARATDPPRMLRWNIEATITAKDDGSNIFPDVRLGDPVHGSLMYDARGTFDYPIFNLSTNYIGEGYSHCEGIEVASMVIENPRTGGQTRFVTDPTGYWNDIQIGDDEIEDSFLAAQSVISPSPLYTGVNPAVMVGLIKPHVDGYQWAPPTELRLEDWPYAKMVFADEFFQDVGATRLEAEIYSLTPVTVSSLIGDYNYDGRVDGGDYSVWRESIGEGMPGQECPVGFQCEDLFYADGTGDFVVDASDYVVWRHAASTVNLSANAGAAVPEPNLVYILVTSMLLLMLQYRSIRMHLPFREGLP